MNDELGDFLSDFMAAPMPTRARAPSPAVDPARQGRSGDSAPRARGPYRPDAPRPVDPSAPFDALVLFVQVTLCDHCAHVESHTSFVALRRPATGGYAYVAYNGSMGGLAHNKPRVIEYEQIRQPFCAVCFGGTPAAPDVERPGRAFFHPSRHTDSDLTLLAARLARIDFTPRQTQTPADERYGQVREDAVPCDPCPPLPTPCGTATDAPSNAPPSVVGQTCPSPSNT